MNDKSEWRGARAASREPALRPDALPASRTAAPPARPRAGGHAVPPAAPVLSADAWDWGLVQQFLVVAEEGSMGLAARRLALSQPTLSRRIATLEEQLGQPLFERGARGVRLTEAGTALVEPARRMAREAGALRLAADSRMRSLQGTVRVTASQVISTYVLPPLLADLRQQQPQIQIELVASDQVEDLIDRRADIAVRMFRPTQPSLIVRRLADMPIGLYAHRDYLARRGHPTPADFASHDYVGMDQRPTLVEGFARAGYPLAREQFGLRSDDSVVQWEAVRAGAGIGVGLQQVARRTPDVQRVFESVPIPPLSAWLVVHRELRGTPRLRLVYDFLAARLAAVRPGR